MHGPTGVEQVVDGFDRAYAQDAAYRVAHHGEQTVPPQGAGTPAVGYFFDYAGRPAVVSGDTVKSANLQRFAEGVDLPLHEALSPRRVAMVGRAAAGWGRPRPPPGIRSPAGARRRS